MAFKNHLKIMLSFGMMAFVGALITCTFVPSSWLTLNFRISGWLFTLGYTPLTTAVMSLTLHLWLFYLLFSLIHQYFIKKVHNEENQFILSMALGFTMLLGCSLQAGLLGGFMVPLIGFFSGWGTFQLLVKILDNSFVNAQATPEHAFPASSQRPLMQKEQKAKAQLEFEPTPTQIYLNQTIMVEKPLEERTSAIPGSSLKAKL